MSEFDDELTADAYLMRRLSLTRRAAQLPASVQFDLARAPIDDEQLEGVLGEFGVELGNGWGIADITHRLLSGEPDTKAVADIKQLQENLKLQGYLPPTYEPTGVWNNQDYIALRQADRDAMDAQRSGKSLLAAPVATGMRLITDTLPSRVWQGVVGAAKGIAAQAQETAERVGVIGGAVGGAAIGAGIGSVVPGPGTAIGAAVGAGAGAVIGFFGDLFGEEPDEADQSGWADILDALHPFNEYAGKEGVHQFFEDLSFVGSAASLASGVGIAARGVTGAVAAARAGVVASETVASPGAMGALAKLSNVPGTMVRTPGTGISLARSFVTPVAGSRAAGGVALALEHPVATGAVLGGFQAMADPNAGITDVLEGAAFGAAGGLAFRAAAMGKLVPGSGNWVKSLRGFQDAHNIMGRPIFQLANGVYTGAAAASIGARLASGELLDTSGKAPTEIARQIRQTRPLSSGMEIPIAGDLIDVAAFVLYPAQLLPAKVGDLARAFDGMLGEAGLKPWISLAQHNDITMTVGKARTAIREFFEPRKSLYTKLHMDAAAEIEAVRLLNELGVQESQNAIAFRRTVAEVKRTMKKDPEYTRKLMAEVTSDAERLQAWALHHMGGDGPFLDNLKKYDEVETHLAEFQREAKRLGTLVDEQPNSLSAIMHQQPGGAIRPVQPTVVPAGFVQENANRLLITQLTRERAARAKLLEAAERSLNKNLKTNVAVRTHQEISALKIDIRALDSQIEGLKAQGIRRKRLADEYHIVAARKDTHTRRSIYEARDEYQEARDAFRDAFAKARKVEDIDDPIARAQAESSLAVRQQEFEMSVMRLQDNGLITPRQAEKVLDRGGRGKASREIENTLEAQALISARDIDLPAETMRYLDERGYKPVITGDEVFVTPEIEDLVDILQVGNYSRRRNFVESLGLGTKHVKEENLYKITHANMVAEVDQVLSAGPVPVPLSGAQALKKLQTYLEARNSKAVVEFPVIGPIATALRFKADIRRLSPYEIEEALGSIKGFDSAMANKVYQALKRGAAFGQDFELRHPILAARQIGRANRISGLPGFSQVIRSWHGKVDPFALGRGKNVLKEDLSYRPPAELANSRERARVIAEVRSAGQLAGIGAREIRESERLLDVMAETAARLRPDIYGSADDFYRRLGVDYRNEYTAAENTLHQIKWDSAAPTTKRLEKLALGAPAEAKNWWSVSGNEIASMFNGGVTKLGNGKPISDHLLMVNLIAATSYNAGPKANITFALKQLQDFKNGRIERPGQLPTVQKALDEIWKGNTIDKWSPELQKAHNVAVGKYHNLTGDLDYLTFDSVMEGLYGMPKAKAEPLVKAVADRLGWHVAEVQAAQWVAFKEETARFFQDQYEAAIKAGDKKAAQQARRRVISARDATTYADALKRDISLDKVAEIYGENLMLRTLQQVEDKVRGAITFGPDYQASIYMYSTGAYDTLLHEAGHLLRRVIPEGTLSELERAYGLRKPIQEIRSADWRRVSGEEFEAARAAVPEDKAHFISPYPAAEIEKLGHAYLSPDGKVGFLLKFDGEIANVFNVSGRKGEGVKAVRAAIAAGGDRVEFFESRLRTLYEAEGFTEAARYPFSLDEIRKDFPNYSIHRNGEPDYVVAHRWSREAEERFAEDFTAFMMGRYQGTDTGAFGTLRAALATMWARNRDAFLDAGVVPLGMHRKFNELLKPEMEKLGLRRAGSSLRSKQVVGGAVLGATEGAITGDQGWEDTLRGALYGAGIGLGARAALTKSYGYLPDALSNLNMALRYTLSFTFDLGRHMEQRTIAAMKYGLPTFGNPTKHLAKSEWKSPYRYGTVTGDTAIADANRFYDELNGTNYFAALQEFEQRNFQRGLLGFAPREYEVVQAFQMYQRGWSKELIHERVAELGRYGLSRTNFERSVNFVFFPFSFQKKLLGTLRDFIFQAPGRNLLIHEGLRRYHASLVDDQFNSLIEDRVPLLEQLWMVNNLAFGASLGRFFLEGIDDRRTRVGQATQILSSFFIPSGAATPLQQAFGAAGDLSVGAFTPVVITGESLSRVGGIDGLDDIVKRYVPFIREVEKWYGTINDQRVAIMSPQHLTPYSQMQEYYEGRDAIEGQYESLATAMGYTTVDGFLDSPMGIMFKADVESQTEELRRQYPQGWEITTQFENQEAIDAAALQDLARKPNKSDGEEAFLDLLARQASLQQMSQWLPEEMADMMESSAIRSYALRWVNDARFAELYDRFMTRTYGPIRRVS